MATYKTGAEMHPTAAAKAEIGFIIVTVGDGYYEVYIDKKIQKSPCNGQTRNYAVAPGVHRVSVYSAGQMVLDDTIRVPAEGVRVAEPAEEPTEEPMEEPAEEPAEEPVEEPAPEPTEEPAPEPVEEPAPEPTEEPVEEPAEGDKITITLDKQTVLDVVTGLEALIDALKSWMEG